MLLPAFLTVRRGYEGPQLVIEWDEPADAASLTSIKVVRRLYGFPQDENDGLAVYDGSPLGGGVVADLNVEACRCYYYKLFVEVTATGLYQSDKNNEGFAIPLQTGYFAEKTFELLPESWKVSDKGLEQVEEVRLALAEAPFSGSFPEVFNIGEDGTVLKGPLRRLLKIIGPMLDEPKALLDCLTDQLDVDDATLGNLRHLATLLGLELNTELSPEKQRNEVRLQVEFLKLKGSIPGIQARLRSVSGLTAEVRELCHDVFITNDLACTSLGFTASEMAYWNGLNNEVCFTVGHPDTPPFWLWYKVFLDLPNGFELNEATARKWCKAVDEASPVCHKGWLVVTDTYDEPIPVGLADEASDSDAFDEPLPVAIAEQATDVVTAFPALWLIVNDETKLTNTNNYQAVVAVPSP